MDLPGHPDCHTSVTPETRAWYVQHCCVCQAKELERLRAAAPQPKYFDLGGTDATWEEQQKAADAQRNALLAHSEAVKQHAALLQQLQAQQALVTLPRGGSLFHYFRAGGGFR